MLYENTLFGDIDKVKIALDRLRAFEPPEGYYFAFSGGKDSICVYHLIKMAGVKHDIHYQVTTIDPPDQVYFIRSFGKEVNWNYPKMPLLQQMLTRGFPIRRHRWCCEYLKENKGEGRIVVTGIRWEESPKRRSRNMVERCTMSGGKHYFHPIIDWTEDEVWEFILKNKLEYCNLYDKGFKRVGCLFCPMAKYKEKLLQAELYPGYYKLFEYYFIKLYNKRKAEGKESIQQWSSGKEMFAWWIRGKSSTSDTSQMSIFG